MDAGDEFVFLEWLGEVIVGANPETLDFVLDAGKAGQDQNSASSPWRRAASAKPQSQTCRVD